MEKFLLFIKYNIEINLLKGVGEYSKIKSSRTYVLFFTNGIEQRKVQVIHLMAWEAAYLAGIIDGEGTITLTRIHKNEHRRPCITIASTDKELLIYTKSLTGGIISNKKNYNPEKHKNSFTLNIKKKEKVIDILTHVLPYLRVPSKRKRAFWIIEHYDKVTIRNGKYSKERLNQKLAFEKAFFEF